MRFAICGLLLLASSGASAQTVNILPNPRLATQQQPTRVQVQVRLTSNRPSGPPEEQLAAQEALRRSLCEHAAKECGPIGEIFRADCRMSVLSITSSSGERGGNGTEIASASANATFDLTPKPAN